MSNSEEWYDTKENGQLRLQYGIKSIYDYLIVEENLFSNRYDLFCFGLVYGMLHNEKKEGRKEAFIPIVQTPVNVRAILNICYLTLYDGRKTNEIFKEMCEYADGGVLALNEIYKEHRSFTIPDLVRDSEELWKKRAKDLQNINLAKS